MMKSGEEKLEKDFDVIRIIKNMRTLKAIKSIQFSKAQSTLLSNTPHILTSPSVINSSTSDVSSA